MSSDKTKQICLWMTIYIYIYILNNLLTNNTNSKGKKPAINWRIKIYNESMSRGKYIYILKKKEKANLVIPIEKKSTNTQLIGQKKKHRKCC